jgi:DNA-binding winged helix-turn-helix (wHTH) protein
MAELPVLIAQTGSLNGQRWGIDKKLHIGRDNDCEIMIPDRQVSRFHACVSIIDKGVLLEDLASKNGTFLNGNPLTGSVLLQDGDSFQIALVQNFIFLSSDATLPLDKQVIPGSFTQKPTEDKIILDSKSRRVWIGMEEIIPPLSVPQFRLLQALFDQKEKVVSRSDLVQAVWGSDRAVGVSEQALDALVRRLRDRLYSIDPTRNFLITVRGHGMRLED